jgi:hypothetical protein
MTQKVVYLRPAKLKKKELPQIVACWPGIKGRIALYAMLEHGNPPTTLTIPYSSMSLFNQKLKANPVGKKTYRLFRESQIYQLWEVRYT